MRAALALVIVSAGIVIWATTRAPVEPGLLAERPSNVSPHFARKPVWKVAIPPLRSSDDPERYRLARRLVGARIGPGRAAERRFDRTTLPSVIQSGRCSDWADGDWDRWEPCWIVVQATYPGSLQRGRPARALTFVSARTGRMMGAIADAIPCPCPSNSLGD
jgi:hypothetical protein